MTDDQTKQLVTEGVELACANSGNNLQSYRSDEVGLDDDGKALAIKDTGQAEYAEGKRLYDDKQYEKALEWFKKAADLGNTYALVKIGKMYREGEGVTKSASESVIYFQNAADADNEWGLYSLALAYENGNGIAKDIEKACHYYKQSADKGFIGALIGLGNIHGGLVEGKKDLDKALYYWTKAANMGSAVAQEGLGNTYFHGKGVKQDFAKAKYYFELSLQDIPLSLAMLALIYAEGHGVDQDNDKALLYAQRALDDNNKMPVERNTVEDYVARVLIRVGVAFLEKQAYDRALELYKRAINLENANKCTHVCNTAYFASVIHFKDQYEHTKLERVFYFFEKSLVNVAWWTECGEKTCVHMVLKVMAEMYLLGRLVQRNVARSLELLNQAYNDGYFGAALTLCSLYANGYGVERDLTKALAFCERSGQKDESCFLKLGRLYYSTGQYDKARACFEEISANDSGKVGDGKSSAACVLAIMFIDGSGIGRDLKVAKEWATKCDSEKADEIIKVIDIYIPDAINKNPVQIVDYSFKINYQDIRLEGLLSMISVEEEVQLFPVPLGERVEASFEIL